jgi:hypothetical protein
MSQPIDIQVHIQVTQEVTIEDVPERTWIWAERNGS